ncbi:hypothetical protein [uncultured Hymenobacter sp.]|uniref:hypothetical protein n=1 Tax=uncultured Hymenobacter sp. TaxID=170016 RepID=UPI0035CA0860
MNFIKLLTFSGLILFGFTACTTDKEPAPEYRLSQEQLAWQGYRQGEVLRFGRRPNGPVRTYRITAVQDRIDTLYVRAGWLPLPQAEPPRYQHVTVMAQRTDSSAFARQILDMEMWPDRNANYQPTLRVQAGWEAFTDAMLPLAEVNKRTPIDTLKHPGTELLPSATFGPTTYSQVIHAVNRYRSGLPPAGIRPTRHLYYVRGKGVVAFVEDGTGLWYRLP